MLVLPMFGWVVATLSQCGEVFNLQFDEHIVQLKPERMNGWKGDNFFAGGCFRSWIHFFSWVICSTMV